MNIDKALEKVKKCLELSKSSNANEAAAALRQAQNLMRIHDLKEGDIVRSEVSRGFSALKASISKPKNWEVMLANLVAKAFGAAFLFVPGKSRTDRNYGSFLFIAEKKRLGIILYTYDVLQRQLLKGRAIFVKEVLVGMPKKIKTIEGDGYCVGWVNAVSEQVYEFAQRECITNEIERQVSQLSEGTMEAQNRKHGVLGQAIGNREGRDITLHCPINGVTQKQLSN